MREKHTINLQFAKRLNRNVQRLGQNIQQYGCKSKLHNWHYVRCPCHGRNTDSGTGTKAAQVEKCLDQHKVCRTPAVDHDTLLASLPLRKGCLKCRNLFSHTQFRGTTNVGAQCVLRRVLFEERMPHQWDSHSLVWGSQCKSAGLPKEHLRIPLTHTYEALLVGAQE